MVSLRFYICELCVFLSIGLQEYRMAKSTCSYCNLPMFPVCCVLMEWPLWAAGCSTSLAILTPLWVTLNYLLNAKSRKCLSASFFVCLFVRLLSWDEFFCLSQEAAFDLCSLAFNLLTNQEKAIVVSSFVISLENPFSFYSIHLSAWTCF